MDLVIEIVLEIYMELMLLIIPEKNVSKKHIIIAKLLAILGLVIIAALLLWGLTLVIDECNLWGIVPIGVAAVLSLAQIVAGTVLYKRYH